MAAGQPTAYKPEYCQMLIDHMSEGFSYESFAGKIDVARKTIYNWERDFPEFLHAKEIGFDKSRIFWENLGVKHILNESESSPGVGSSSRSLNSSVWIFNMKNRFQWRDRPKEEIEDEAKANAAARIQVSIEDVRQALLSDPVERSKLRMDLKEEPSKE